MLIEPCTAKWERDVEKEESCPQRKRLSLDLTNCDYVRLVEASWHHPLSTLDFIFKCFRVKLQHATATPRVERVLLAKLRPTASVRWLCEKSILAREDQPHADDPDWLIRRWHSARSCPITCRETQRPTKWQWWRSCKYISNGRPSPAAGIS